MQDSNLLQEQSDTSPPASPQGVSQKKSRRRTTTACNACRARRTKCDSRKPACSYCRSRGLRCQYEHNLSSSNSRVQAELAAINQRLDHITGLLPATQQSTINNNGIFVARDQVFTGQEKSPFQLLGTDSVMSILGLEPGFARDLLTQERSPQPAKQGNPMRVRMIQQQHALTALAAFSTYVHVWYPVLRPGFSERYLNIISGSLTPSPESCLVLLVAAVGTLAHHEYVLGRVECEDASDLYLEAAMASLSAILIDDSISSAQCLLLLSIYYCCLSKPCQAYDYAMIASFKIQNLLKYVDVSDGELHEHAKRAYWAVLLIESEIHAQFDLIDSGIWNYDDHISLPDGRRTWKFDMEAGSPQSIIAPSPQTTVSLDQDLTDQTQAYFLAEISMRRMLHRCNTAIRRTAEGEIVYAPGIALELELQLDEWYDYLPDTVRFEDTDFDSTASPPNLSSYNPLSNFLRVQYYSCKISIYWPAVYQCIQDGKASAEVLKHCERFFNAYIQLMPSILTAVHDCIVNRWTLFASIFMTSMAVIQAAQTDCIRNGCQIEWSHLQACLRSTRTVDQRIIQDSPSLSLLDDTLIKRLNETYAFLDTTRHIN